MSKFRVTDDKGLFTAKGVDLAKTYFVIWTTTTWTLPGNVAICLGPEFDYSLIKCGRRILCDGVRRLMESAMKEAASMTDYEVVATFKGS